MRPDRVLTFEQITATRKALFAQGRMWLDERKCQMVGRNREGDVEAAAYNALADIHGRAPRQRIRGAGA